MIIKKYIELQIVHLRMEIYTSINNRTRLTYLIRHQNPPPGTQSSLDGATRDGVPTPFRDKHLHPYRTRNVTHPRNVTDNQLFALS